MSWAAELERKNTAQLETFGEGVTFNRQAGGSLSISAIVMNPSRLEISAPNVNVLMWFRLTDFAGTNPKMGDTVVRNSVSYRVVDVAASVDGGVTLALQRTS